MSNDEWSLINAEAKIWENEDGHWYVVGGRRMDPSTFFDDESVGFNHSQNPRFIADEEGLLGRVVGDDIRLNQRATDILKEKYPTTDSRSGTPTVVMTERPMSFDPEANQDELLIKVVRPHGEQEVYYRSEDDSELIYQLEDEIHGDDREIDILGRDKMSALMRQLSALNVEYLNKERLSDLGFEVDK